MIGTTQKRRKMETTHDYLHLSRDLSEVFETISKGQTNFLSNIPVRGEAKNPKHEWFEDVIEPSIDALDGDILPDDEVITVVDGSKFAVGDILAFARYDEAMKVISVDGNDLTVFRGYGDSVAVAMEDDTVVRVVSRPKPEGSDPGFDSVTEPKAEFNFTQIFDRTAKISKSATSSQHLVLDDIVDFHVKHHLELIQMELNAACIYGRRYSDPSSPEIPRTMGGILHFIDREGGNIIDKEGMVLGLKDLNNLIEMIAEDGGHPNAILVNTAQARRISAFNFESFPSVRTTWTDKRTGGAIYEFVGDLPLGIVEKIIVDTAFPQDKVAILDTTKLALVPMRGRAFKDLPATPSPAADYVARRIIGEYTLEVRNGLQAHGILKNLLIKEETEPKIP